MKAFGFTLLCILALSAAVTSPASAEGFFFGSEEDETVLTGSQTGEGDVFTTTAGSLSCSSVTYEGSTDEGQFKTFEVEPSYSGCTALGVSATVDVNECAYLLKAKTEEGPPYGGELDIVCPEENEITVTVSLFGTTKCVIHIPPQSGIQGVSFTNTGSGSTRAIQIDLGVSGLQYSHTAGTGLGACSSGSSSSGTYDGAALIKGEDESGAHVGLAINLAAATEVTPSPTSLDFSKSAVGAEKTVMFKNNYASSKKFEIVQVVDVNTKKEEAHYKVVKHTCTGYVLSLGECEVKVKLEKKEGVGRWLLVQYSTGWPWSTGHKIKVDIGS